MMKFREHDDLFPGVGPSPNDQPHDPWTGLPLKPTPTPRYPPQPTVLQSEDVDYEACLREEQIIADMVSVKGQETSEPATDLFGRPIDDLLNQLQIPTLASAPPQPSPHDLWVQLPDIGLANSSAPTTPTLDDQDLEQRPLADNSLPSPDHSLERVMQAMGSPEPHFQKALPTEQPADLSSMIAAAHEQQLSGGLEALIQQATPEHLPDPFDRQQLQFDQPTSLIIDHFDQMGPMI